MSTPMTIAIVGASVAGATAAAALRDEGYDGRILLIGEESQRPYERPPLSKGYLRGEVDRAKAFVHARSFYEEQRIELRTGTTVGSLLPDAHEIVLQDGERLRYDRLLLTTGSAPRRLHIPGSELDGVHYLRSMADADGLADALSGAARVAVIGAGWIGAEVAASARQLGRGVAMIDPFAVPLQRVLGPEVGAIYAKLHADHGVDLRLNTGVESIRGTTHVEGVSLSDGSTIPADLVVVGIGALPRVELAAAAGISVDDGIVVDAQLRSSAPDIFAAGDVASAFHPFYGMRIRVEHWANAMHQGPVAARNMLGISTDYDRLPYFFSDQYDLGMEYSGYATTWDEVVLRGDPSDGKFIAFWLAGGVIVAAMNANVWDVTDPIQHLIRQRITVSPDVLADLDTPIEALGGV